MVGDGIDFVRRHKDTFDVIIVDSTDPVGPAVGLFSAEFYADVHAALMADGLFVAQSESPWLNRDLIAELQRRIGGLFPVTGLCSALIPTYPSGYWTVSLGSKVYDPLTAPVEERFAQAGFTTRYYTPGLHRAAFQLPQFSYVLSWQAQQGQEEGSRGAGGTGTGGQQP